MITTIITAVKTIGSFFTRFITDYISNIVVTAILFPGEVLKKATTTYSNLVKPLVISF